MSSKAGQNAPPAGGFALGTFTTKDASDAPFPGLVVGDQVIDLRGHISGARSVLGLLGNWERSFAQLQELVSAEASVDHELSTLRALAPVQSRQILCAGANYYNHVRQIVVSTMRAEGDGRSEDELKEFAEDQLKRRAADQPFIFGGLPSAMVGAEDDVVLWGPGKCHDWELELAAVIGKGARNIPEADALEYVAGYTISNDISTRDVMNRPKFPMTDFLMTKSRPTFFPTGPYLVPRAFVPDPKALEITLKVNGEVMQHESVSDIIHGVERLVSYASTVVELSPGDMILTGSPAGNAGHHDNRWLVPGDVIEGSITGLGTQRNRCVADPTA